MILDETQITEQHYTQTIPQQQKSQLNTKCLNHVGCCFHIMHMTYDDCLQFVYQLQLYVTCCQFSFFLNYQVQCSKAFKMSPGISTLICICTPGCLMVDLYMHPWLLNGYTLNGLQLPRLYKQMLGMFTQSYGQSTSLLYDA